MNQNRVETQSMDEERDNYNYQVIQPKNKMKGIKVTRDQQTGVMDNVDNIRLVH